MGHAVVSSFCNILWSSMYYRRMTWRKLYCKIWQSILSELEENHRLLPLFKEWLKRFYSSCPVAIILVNSQNDRWGTQLLERTIRISSESLDANWKDLGCVGVKVKVKGLELFSNRWLSWLSIGLRMPCRMSWVRLLPDQHSGWRFLANLVPRRETLGTILWRTWPDSTRVSPFRSVSYTHLTLPTKA